MRLGLHVARAEDGDNARGLGDDAVLVRLSGGDLAGAPGNILRNGIFNVTHEVGVNSFDGSFARQLNGAEDNGRLGCIINDTRYLIGIKHGETLDERLKNQTRNGWGSDSLRPAPGVLF